MPESLGKILKKIREARHLSIEEVSERSRIPRHIVRILEEDRLNEINSVFYAKSFVKTYAVFLGALHEACVKEYLAMGKKNQETVSKPAAVKYIPKVSHKKIVSVFHEIRIVLLLYIRKFGLKSRGYTITLKSYKSEKPKVVPSLVQIGIIFISEFIR